MLSGNSRDNTLYGPSSGGGVGPSYRSNMNIIVYRMTAGDVLDNAVDDLMDDMVGGEE